ncbi:amino acid adenylation domain-containing protein [Streptomyces sp. HSW2009]|uniref:non-ribosomal peptide synthetase n=1 Tax=Streptomyces sp. HSW2009 TaxID=3142890 RepID=UPI0032EFEB9D
MHTFVDQPGDGPSRGRAGFQSVPAMIEAAADRFPDRPAVTHDGRTLSYRTLDALAGGLADELAGRGLRRGDVVPVALGNSLELPVTLLALMKLGAVFVPVDAAWPTERLAVALALLAPRAVLCADPRQVPPAHRALAVRVPPVERLPTAAGRRAVEFDPSEAIYGFFTSGTTGTPKCAINVHGGLANRFRFMSRYFHATGDEVVLQNSRHTFDSSLWQLLWPLTEGGRTVLPVHTDFLDLRRTITTISAHRITAADFVSSVFNALVATVEDDPDALAALASLRWLIVGSEPVNPRTVRRLTSLLPDLHVTNGYGPTEASIGMAFHPMSAADRDTVPVGRPIDNCAAVIVNERLEALPAGHTGEIAIGGACLGAGYLGAPAATAAAFVPNPFPDLVPTDRLYLTGDLGSMDEQGRLFCAGRKDAQVKIGGVRIELGEVKAAAESCPGVVQAEALVAEHAREGAAGPGRWLALFAVCADGAGVDEVLAHLRGTLPRTSVPRRVLLLPRMPLGDNGKTDLRELAHVLDRRVAAEAAETVEGAAPDELGGRVLWAMRAALNLPRLDPDDHFFDSGGDSLTALSVVNAVRAGFDLPQLCAQDVFDQPTAARLTLLAETYRADGAVHEREEELLARDALTPLPPVRAAAADAGEPRTVLVTGATGFVGAQVVHEWLATAADTEVVCLVRAGSDARAGERVVGSLRERGLWRPEFADRLRAYAADLALPGLGLAAQVRRDLAHGPDLVLHCGALVNFLFDYRAHRRANVLGVAELLGLAGEGRPVPLHHVSTLAALQGARADHPAGVPEGCDLRRVPAPPGGYNRSKWVAEQQVAAARRQGATVTVLRLGEVMPATASGLANPAALTHLLLTAVARLGVRPAAQMVSDYTPADYAARRIVHAVRDRSVWGTDLHLLHPASVDFGTLLTELPAAPQPVPCADFLALLRKEATDGGRESAALAALLPDPDHADEDELRVAFEELLTDNPRHYRSDACRGAERRWGLNDGSLDEPVAAYRRRLAQQTDDVAPRGPAPDAGGTQAVQAVRAEPTVRAEPPLLGEPPAVVPPTTPSPPTASTADAGTVGDTRGPGHTEGGADATPRGAAG